MEQTKYIGADSWMGNQNDELTFRMIILEHIRRIASLGSKELREGYWKTYNKAVAGMTLQEKVWVDDSREAYISAVLFLYDTLHAHMPEETETKITEIEDQVMQETNRTKAVHIARKLYRHLNAFLKSTNYMEFKSEIDE